MDSDANKTLDFQLDPDLLKSWEHFSLDSSQSHTFSDNSESDNDEPEQNQEDLIEQLKNLSFNDVTDSKFTNSKCSNEISEKNSLEKVRSGAILVESKDIEKNRSSSLKDNKLLKILDKNIIDSTLCECINKNCEINSKKENNTEKLSFEENLENVENQLYSLSIKNNKLLNKYHKKDSGISAGAESDSDESDQAESSILRERDPTRHNRSENNKQHRTTPFSKNHKTYKPNLNSNNHQKSEHFVPHLLYDFNASSNDHGFINHINNIDFERYGIVSSSNITCHSGFPTTESMTYAGMVSSIEADQIFNYDIPCIAANQRVNGIVPCAVTDQVVDGVIPLSVNAIFDSVVPSVDDFGNSNDKFSEDIHDTLCFDHLKELNFSGCEVPDVKEETFLESYLEGLTVEEMDNIKKSLTESTLDNLSSQNHADLIEESSFNNSYISNQNFFIESSSKAINNPKKNQHNFLPETGQDYSSFSKPNHEESLSFSNSCEENVIFGNSDKFYESEYLVNKPGNYSNLICENISSINCESLSPKTSDYRIVSNEIEYAIVKEMEKLAKKSQKDISVESHEINSNMFPFDRLDDNAFSECITNKPENKISDKKKTKGKKINIRKDINQTCKSPEKIEKTKICWMLGTEARDRLFNSSSFHKQKWEEENETIRQQIRSGMLGTKQKKVIHVLKKNRTTKYRGTNLHYAILSDNTEKVFCIVECHKEYHDDINEINLRDSFNKTVLDYAKQKGMHLLADYLEENTAMVSINIE